MLHYSVLTGVDPASFRWQKQVLLTDRPRPLLFFFFEVAVADQLVCLKLLFFFLKEMPQASTSTHGGDQVQFRGGQA
jgi:hypothetical protein